MKVRIYRSLLLMGIVSVIVTFILSAILYYQGMQEQFSHELQHLNSVMAGAVSADDEEAGKAYLSRVYKDNDKTIHIVWLDRDGSVIYDSDNKDEDYASGPEVKEAMEKGKGDAVHRDANDNPKSYYAQKAPDGTILRLSSARTVSYKGFSAYLPEIILFLLVFVVGCLFAAERETEKILKPFHLLGDLVQKIMEGQKVDDVPSDYKELKPLIRKVKEQHDEIQNYLDDIEEERNTIRTVVDTISDGIILLNEHKEIVDYNRKIVDIFHPAEDKRYRRIASLYHNEDWLRVIGKAYRTEGRQEYTMNLFDKPYRMVMNKIELSDGETGLLIVLRDMTASYMAEKMRREFSANVSHELKTPLTSISGFAEMIANGMYQKPDDVKLFGSRIVNESQRMLTLIDTIMHLSRIEETETTITWKTVSMDSLVRYAADLIEPQAKAKGVTISVDAEPLYTYGNAALLSELVMNLLDNAVKYNKEGGRVHALLQPEGEDKLSLTISDNGIGIPKEKQDRVFERFYRAEESRNKSTGGSGLGLAICKHIVEKHKGTLSMTSEEGKGTTFTVILPRMSEADVSRETTEELTARKEAEDAESGRLAQQEAAEDRAAEMEEQSEKGSQEEKRLHKAKKMKKDKKAKKKSGSRARSEGSVTKPDKKNRKAGREEKRKK
ncbi:cell wall metabolism sensor histidine kinase WalK [uncultured Dialister sp.]|mgnify:FL=1|uniref:sensor histidine kinase n=1 Tax=uncultured Dialister sp. TaxID=278064 RepID=UPI0025DCC865|nr:ATP-binding protein [uncultured Dialister sp.]